MVWANINFNIPTVEYYAVIKIKVETLYIIQRKDVQDILLIEKNVEEKYT